MRWRCGAGAEARRCAVENQEERLCVAESVASKPYRHVAARRDGELTSRDAYIRYAAEAAQARSTLYTREDGGETKRGKRRERSVCQDS